MRTIYLAAALVAATPAQAQGVQGTKLTSPGEDAVVLKYGEALATLYRCEPVLGPDLYAIYVGGLEVRGSRLMGTMDAAILQTERWMRRSRDEGKGRVEPGDTSAQACRNLMPKLLRELDVEMAAYKEGR